MTPSHVVGPPPATARGVFTACLFFPVEFDASCRKLRHVSMGGWAGVSWVLGSCVDGHGMIAESLQWNCKQCMHMKSWKYDFVSRPDMSSGPSSPKWWNIPGNSMKRDNCDCSLCDCSLSLYFDGGISTSEKWKKHVSLGLSGMRSHRCKIGNPNPTCSFTPRMIAVVSGWFQLLPPSSTP